MSLSRKLIGRVAPALFRSTALYRLVRSLGAQSHVEYRSLNDIRNKLSGVSAQPTTGNPPASRAWPEQPSVDITVIVPCYKTERFISDCLDSILNQKCNCSFEVLTIDDGSPDATGSILDRYVKEDSRVRVIHQENRGFSGARNAGLDAMGGSGRLCRLGR